MNHWEDKEGLLPTKTTLCGEYNRRTKALSLEQQLIPDEPGPEPSCVSVKSDWSNGRLIDFRPQQPSAANRIHSDSPAPSCMSFKSNRSKLEPITFRDGPEQQVDQEGLEVPCSPSTQQHQAHLDSIIMLLEENIVTFVKNELKKIQKVLRSDYPECSESQWEDEGVLDSEDEEQRRSSREAFLKISLHFLRKMKQEELADRLQRNSCELTLDTNTLNRHLKLSDNNRMVTSVKEVQSYSYHPDRFDWWEQVLCRTGLTGRCYWEVEWRGGVYISVSYKGISRRGDGEDCEFGGNEKSWSLSCSGVCYSVCHNNRETKLSSSFFSPFSSSSVFNRVAVYVDCPAGTLSFYSVSSGTLIHLYTFNTTFTEPLYPGFGFGFWSGSSVSLCSLVGLRDSSY